MSSKTAPRSQAVICIDHHGGEIQFLNGAPGVHLKEHAQHTRQHGSSVRSEHDFFRDVCDALTPIGEILVVGSHMAQADFRRYVEKHRPALMPALVGWETIGHLTPAQVHSRAREFFEKYDRMHGRAHIS